MSDFLTTSDAATVNRLARIIRDGSNADCEHAFARVLADHGRDIGLELWDKATRHADQRSENDNRSTP